MLVIYIIMILKGKFNFPIRISGEAARVDRVHRVAAAASVVSVRISSVGAGFVR